MPSRTVAGLYSTVVSSLVRLAPIFRSGCATLHPQQQRVRVPTALPSPSALVTILIRVQCCLLVVETCLPDDTGCCGAPFHVLIWHPCVFFVQVCSSFCNQVIFLFLRCRSSLYILNNSLLSGVCFADILPPSLWLIFSFSWYCLLQNRSFEF